MASEGDVDHCVKAYMHVLYYFGSFVLMLRGRYTLSNETRQFNVWDAVVNASYSVP